MSSPITATYTKLTNEQKELVDAAEQALQHAYNPYSHFFVGAALRASDGTIIGGANVENAAYGSTICAERSAIMHANAIGKRNITHIAIIGKGESFDTTEVSGPCGACRQVLFEFSEIVNHDMEVLMSTTKKDKIVITTINALLPFAFGPRDVHIDVTKYRT